MVDTGVAAEETCQKCGKAISRRAKANIWNGEMVVCTPCLKDLQAAVQRQEHAHQIAGKAGGAWLVHDSRQQHGPYTTQQLIDYLRGGQIHWSWTVWRDGMKSWRPVAGLFTVPDLCEGRLELRDFGQGDGTYRP